MKVFIMFRVFHQTIYRADTLKPVAGSKNYLYAKFEFSKEWESAVKTVIFHEKGKTPIKRELDANDECLIPADWLMEPGIKTVSVYGGDLITANVAEVVVGKSGYSDSAVRPYSDVLKELLEGELTELYNADVTKIGDYAFYFRKDIKSVEFPNVEVVGDYAFCVANGPSGNREGLLTVKLPKVKNISKDAFSGQPFESIDLELFEGDGGDSQFRYCSFLSKPYMPKLKAIPDYMFQYCESLKEITDNNFPNVTYIGREVFYHCEKLEAVTLSKLIELGNSNGGAFKNCSKLKTLNLPVLEKIANNTFYYCSEIEKVDFPNVIYIGDDGSYGSGGKTFYYCTAVKEINLPKVTYIPYYCFYNCTSLTEVTFPEVTGIGSYAFQNCTALKKADLAKCSEIKGYSSFYGCSTLEALILRTDTVCTLGSTSAFSNTPINSGLGYIYVPSTLVEAYKSAANWSAFQYKIRAIEDYPEICGSNEE